VIGEAIELVWRGGLKVLNKHSEFYDFDMLLFAILAIMVICAALLRPLIPYDTMAYHLPFATKLANVPKADDFFLYSKYYRSTYADRFLGFPLLPYYVQGYLFSFTQAMAYLPLVAAVPLLLLANYAGKLFHVSRSIYLCLCLTVPMIAIHAHCSFVDLFSGALVAALAFITIKFLENQPSFRERIYLGVSFIFVSLLCGQTKFFTIPAVYALCLVGMWAAFSRCETRKQALVLVLIFCLAASAASFKLLSNWVIFKNPFYPVSTMFFSGPEPVWATDPGYLKFLGPLARPAYFILSITELHIFLNGFTPLYNVLHSTRGDEMYMAGFGFINVAAFLFWQMFFYFRKAKRPDTLVDNTAKILLLLLVLTAIMPQAHVLRYWMYIPFVAALLVIFELRQFRYPVKVLFIICSIAIFWINNTYYIESPYQLFNFDRIRSIPISVPPIEGANKVLARTNVGPLPIERIHKLSPSYVCTGDTVMFPFAFSTVLNGGSWKTNPPECSQPDNTECKCFVDYVGSELIIRDSGCSDMDS